MIDFSDDEDDDEEEEVVRAPVRRGVHPSRFVSLVSVNNFFK